MLQSGPDPLERGGESHVENIKRHAPCISRGILREWFLWAAMRFERAYVAVQFAGTIQKRLGLISTRRRIASESDGTPPSASEN